MGDDISKLFHSDENHSPNPKWSSEGISDDTCDVPVCEDSSTFDALNDHSKILSDSNDDDTSSDDDDFEDIEYVSPEEVNDVNQEESKRMTVEKIFFKSKTLFFPDQGGLTSIVMDEISENSQMDPLLELPEFESFHFDPSFPRPPPEPPNREVRLMFSQKIEDDNPSHLSLELFSRFSPTLRILLYFSPPGVKTLFLTPASPLRAGGISLGWNFHDCPDFEDSRVHGFIHSYIRASYPQLHLGNPIS
ncbi:hypothetical protein Tco_1355376 [Tanacetum coccineum]